MTNIGSNNTILITTKQVLEKIGLGRTKLYYLMESPNFPKPIRFAKNCIRWDLAEIEAWIDANKARR
ncbi:AlpA family phage regulatory protein [Gilliamella apicola]|uniref:AlpA family phage regulatory protein n=1 Tax=Gilliamella apicola TaxID=1196095 RepID=A0A556RSH3_9GAMM|nr:MULTISPECIES: AlpA family phage regulatory protein [Gilliamella]MBI0113528.1 AlpA family phage regulatory protein [Gilliamella sp. W8123]MBI0116935.1 AlpA family phage regulatory protein [Gilliamella sp. W8129]TSJ91856.1 AlpA family phage regulatory protein [Gilliamella apicola]